jgi:hypothetical protein
MVLYIGSDVETIFPGWILADDGRSHHRYVPEDPPIDPPGFQVQGDDRLIERPQKIYGEILYHIPIVPKGSGG